MTHTLTIALGEVDMTTEVTIMSVIEFEQAYPQYAFNMLAPLKRQQRIYGGPELNALPVELKPITKRIQSSRRNGPNRNQTRTHFQCKECHRVLRNDFFQSSRQHREANTLHSYCNECKSSQGRERSKLVGSEISRRRVIVWQYIAPRCVVCGFDKSIYALDMHHLSEKDFQIASLVTSVCNAKNTNLHQVVRLCAEAERCVPLCANCHRRIHAGELQLPGVQPLQYDPIELIMLLRDSDRPFQYNLAEAI